MIALLTFLTFLLLCFRYSGVILTWIISFITKTEIRIGEVGFFCLYDISIKIANSFAIHIEIASLSRDRAHPTRFGILRLDDVRIETEPIKSLRRNEDGQSCSEEECLQRNMERKIQRLTRVAQYCGLVVNRVHIVVMNAIPDCLIHFTIDELTLETFRSRDGWQFETTCSLLQGKLLRRNVKSGNLLAEVSMPFKLSVDTEKTVVKNVNIRISMPTFIFTEEFVFGFAEYLERRKKERLDEKIDNFRPSTTTVDIFETVQFDVESLNLKYMVSCENRYITVRVNNLTAFKTKQFMKVSLCEFHLMDQLLRSDCRIESLFFERDTDGNGLCHNHGSIVRIISKISFHDFHWWAKSSFHVPFARIVKCFTTKTAQNGTGSTASLFLEASEFHCEFLDFENQKSVLRVGYFTFEKLPNGFDMGVELLYFGSRATSEPIFGVHEWGESLFVGAIILQSQTKQDSKEPNVVIVGCDDVKFEWSLSLCNQIELILKNLIPENDGQPDNNVNNKSKPTTVHISANRCALIVDVNDQSYVAIYFSTAEVVSNWSKKNHIVNLETVQAIKGCREGNLDLSTISETTMNPTSIGSCRENSPTRRWNNMKRNEYQQRESTDERKTPDLFLRIDLFEIVIDGEEPLINKLMLKTPSPVFLRWSPELHLIVFGAFQSIRKLFMNFKSSAPHKVPRKLSLSLLAGESVEVMLDLARNHKILWKGDSFTLERFDGSMNVNTKLLRIVLDDQEIVTVDSPVITVKPHDEEMTQSRIAFATLISKTNKIWMWTAEKFIFHLPFDFNFACVFDEFINMIKWIKIVHEFKKSDFTESSPLPSDVIINIEKLVLELEDDFFENKLKLSALLKEDEVYEAERREQLLEERLSNLKKASPFFSKEMVANIKNSLIRKTSQIYIDRWNMSEVSDSPLFISTWTGLSIRALADISLHGTEKCIQMMKAFDPLSHLPHQNYSTLWGRAIEFDVDEWTVSFKDYPMKYLDIKDLHLFGTLVAAESITEDGRSIRECTIPLPDSFPTHSVMRNMSPMKFYYDLQCASSEFTCTYGPCWEPCLSMISLVWNNISAPSIDPSQPLPFWDKMRFLLHGKLLWASERMVTTMLASNDPYNETETVEMCWEDFGLDWALGEIRIKSGLKIFLRTASRYDDSQILSLPDVRLKVLLGWECKGDPHDHHAVQLCSPKRLPLYSSTDEHDTYRQFRSSCVNITFNFDVSPGSCTSPDKMPNLLLYSNTFRWIEQFLKSLTTKNRNVRRGKVFGNRVLLKPQLSKHFGKLQFSFSLPKILVTYWMSHASSYGFRVFSDGLQLTSSFRQTVQHSSINREMNVQRRKVYSWSTHHMTCTWWATQIHVYGGDSRPPTDGSSSEDTFLLGFGRVQYARETHPGKETPLHKVTAYDLKMAWTAENRDACLTIADGVHRAHMLRRILSNDAVKTLNVHLEEAIDTKPKESKPRSAEKSHRRGYSVTEANPWMLSQLIDEVGTKLVAHCEQASDVPIDSLFGVQQTNMDDVKLLNWQIDLFNSQLVLKGCERDGFLLVSASKSQLLQNFHRNVWKESLLLSKKSWNAKLSGMQYFAPISATGTNKKTFQWLPREVIDDKNQENNGFADDFVQKFTATGEAVGGVVQSGSEESDIAKKIQLQRIVSRCSCQIFFCFFSDELKTDSSEDISVPPQLNVKHAELNTEAIGVDVLTLKHNMLEATSNSEQYEMVVDIVNNLALFVDPYKKELGEKRRRLRFECQLMSMEELRNKIMRYQSELREVVSLGRHLEKQLFYLNQGEYESVEGTEEELTLEAEDTKLRILSVSERLATYISSYKQRQVNQIKEYDDRSAKKGIEVIRRFEVCFEDCIWKLTESDGQIALAETQIRNFLYTRTVRDSNCGDHLFEVGSVRITNLMPDTVYKHALHRDETHQSRQPAIRLFVRDMPPVGGISVKEHFELNIAPMVAEITHKLFDKMMRFFFPGRNIHTKDTMENDEETKFSLTRKIASSFNMKSNKSAAAKIVSSHNLYEKDDIDRMKERADKVNHFMYIKIPEVSFVVSYKGNKDKNLIDVNQFNFIFPLCEYHEQNWAWLDLALAVKQRCKRVLLQQFMRQKLLRNRISNFSIEPSLQGISEEEKKRIAVGITTPDQKILKASK